MEDFSDAKAAFWMAVAGGFYYLAHNETLLRAIVEWLLK